MNNPPRPKPPDHIDGEALLEWQRVCDDLEAAGLPADRALLTVYVNTWAVWHNAQMNVDQFGPLQELPNKIITSTPYYDITQQKIPQLRGLLNDMGLTFKTRPRTAAAPAGEFSVD